jgi:hypothetical protein
MIHHDREYFTGDTAMGIFVREAGNMSMGENC